MNKHTVIVIIASVVIGGTVGYSLFNAFAVSSLKIASSEQGTFSYFDLMSYNKITICNPLPVSVKMDRLEIVTYYDNANKGTFSINPTTIAPQSSSIVKGEFKSELFVETQYLFLHLDGELSGDQPVRIDPTKMFVVTNIDSPIIGVIPYTITHQYTGFDFYNMMKDRTNFTC